MNPTEKLIMLVQTYPCLYKIREKDYRNSFKKEIIWKKISKELKQSRHATKKKWKNLRDGYTKYKKEINGTTSQPKKYLNWVWGPYLKFLDSAIEPRPATSNIHNSSTPSENSINSPSRSPLPSFEEGPIDESTSPLTPHETSAIKRKCDTEDDVEKVWNYLKNKKKHDAIDLLFASYAESFKKLKARTQVEVKLKVAQIFTEAELNNIPYIFFDKYNIS